MAKCIVCDCDDIVSGKTYKINSLLKSFQMKSLLFPLSKLRLLPWRRLPTKCQPSCSTYYAIVARLALSFSSPLLCLFFFFFFSAPLTAWDGLRSLSVLRTLDWPHHSRTMCNRISFFSVEMKQTVRTEIQNKHFLFRLFRPAVPAHILQFSLAQRHNDRQLVKVSHLRT